MPPAANTPSQIEMSAPEVAIPVAGTPHLDLASSPDQIAITIPSDLPLKPAKPEKPTSSPSDLLPSLSVVSLSRQQAADRQPGERKDFHQKIFKTPKETGMAFVVTAQNKAAYSWLKLILLSFVAGVFLSFGGILSIAVGKGMPEFPEGIQKLLFGFCFSIGLAYVVIMGADLFTGNTMIMTVGLLNRSITWKDYARSLTMSFIFNFIGSVFAAAFFGYFTNLFVEEPYLSAVRAIAVKKILLAPHVVLLRGIAANWLVNIAIFMAAGAESIEGKILASIIPIANFVSSSFEHSIANMFYVPLGLMYGAESDFGTFIYRNLILATIGNWIGGAIFVGAVTWLAFVRDAPPPPPKPGKEKAI